MGYILKASNAKGESGLNRYISMLAGNTNTPINFDSGAMFPIAMIFGNNSATTLSFTSIPQTYKHLQIRFIGRDTYNSGGSQTDSNLYMKFNGSSASYRNHSLYGDGSTSGSGSSTDPFAGRLTGYNSTAGMFGTGVLDILNYTSTSQNKTIKGLSGWDQNGSGLIFFLSELWYATPAPITQIDLTTGNGTAFATGSQFALYGILG